MEMKFFVRIIILMFFSFVYLKSIIFGTQGIRRYFEIKNEIEIEKTKILNNENKIKNLKVQIDRWLNDDFELEKMAREELQMGYANERVYLIKKI
jgi:cell division protein FtsB